MNDLNGIKNIQNAAVVEEYRKAVVSGNTVLAAKIKEANPDLVQAFEVVATVLG